MPGASNNGVRSAEKAIRNTLASTAFRESFKSQKSSVIVATGDGRRTSGQLYHGNRSSKKLKRPEGMDRSFFKAVDETISVVQDYFAPSGGRDWPSVADVVLECFIAADKVYGEDQANEFAKDFKWKESQLSEDLAAYTESRYDIGAMIGARQQTDRGKRLNLERIGRLRSDNPEIANLTSLCEGMIVPLPTDFRPNALCDKDIERLLCMQRAFYAWTVDLFGPDVAIDPCSDPCAGPYNRPLHKSYERTYMAVDMMLSALRDQRVAFVLPKELLQQHSTLHLMQGKWVSKHGKDIGRNIGDMSYGEPPYLNGKFAKQAAAAQYGAIVHPTLNDIVLLFLSTYDRKKAEYPELEWQGMVIWVMDIASAYTNLNIPAKHAHLFAQELKNGLVAVHHGGVFGGSITPAAFQPVTRCVVHELRATTKGGLDMYVDDLYGICVWKHVQYEMARGKHVITDLLGDKTVQEEKNVTGQIVKIIGWEFNLLTQKVSVARKNMMKAIYCIYNVDLDRDTNLRKVQRLASYLERYSVICRILRPFMSCLYRLMKECYGLRRDFPFSEEAKTEIRMWRGWMYLLSVDTDSYARPFVTFRPRPPSYVVTTDGSLGQIGIIIYQITQEGETCVGCSAVSIADFGFGDDSSYQNTCEYIGMVLGVLALVKLGVRGVDVVVRGDSTSALSWMEKQKVSGSAAMNAALVLVSICIKFGIEVNYTVFLSGLLNFKADRLSRIIEKNMSLEQAMEMNGHRGAKVVNLTVDPASAVLVDMCDPRRSFSSDSDFKLVWGAIRDAVEALGA
jgi:hypothetical protein